MLEKILENKKILIVIDIILLIISIMCYKYIYDVELLKNRFLIDSVNFAEENKNPIFKVEKIILYSNAHAIDNSADGKLQDIDISQYTDIAIYINNKGKTEEITAENTVYEMFIDNIEVTTNQKKGEFIINYKNPKEFGKYSNIENYKNDGFIFNIINTNKEQQETDVNNNNFYTDCSNPITLGFINKNIMTNCKISDVNGSIKFDGSILKNAKVNLKDISGQIKFTIHIKNNLGEDFACNLTIDNNLEEGEQGLYSGYIMKILNTDKEAYNFLKV